MTDRTTKTLLLTIAVGVWLHLIGSWWQAVPVQVARAPRFADYFDYRQLVVEQRVQGVSLQEIRVDLLTHIAGNTRARDR